MNLKIIKMEISKTKAAQLATLGSRKMRRKHRMFMAEGEKCAADTLGAFTLLHLVATPGWLEHNPEAFGVDKALVVTASPQVMAKVSTLATPPEVIAVFRLPEPAQVEPRLDASSLSLLLDGIQDPGNLGTILRTADWFGFDTVYASPDTVDVFNPKAVQATMGAMKRVKVVYTDLPQLLSRTPGLPVFGTLLDGKDIFGRHLPQCGAIVMGNEGNGLGDAVRRMVTDPLLIPPAFPGHTGESLNVAVATAIVLAEFRNPRIHLPNIC